MKVILLGTSEFAWCCGRALLEAGVNLQAVISLPADLLPDNSVNARTFAESNQLSWYEFADINSPECIATLRKMQPDYLFSAWPKIIDKEVLEIPRYFCIGTHPTELPLNRGRHALHWLIYLGIQNTALSFFKINEGIDKGNLLLKTPFSITEQDSIKDVVEKMGRAGFEGTLELFEMLRRDQNFNGTPQGPEAGNYWRKRTRHDVTLDLRMSAENIVRTVRSFSPPYPGSLLIFKKMVLNVVEAAMLPKNDQTQIENLEPGRILLSGDDWIDVKAADYIVRLHFTEQLPQSVRKAPFIEPPTKYFAEYGELLLKNNALHSR